MDFRTDLALERHEILEDSAPKGVESAQYRRSVIKFTKIMVTDSDGSKALGKPIGTYITAELPPLSDYSPVDEEIIEALADELRSLLPKDGTVLAAGLGNTDITPDAVGPKSVSMVLATRHLSRELLESTGLGNLRPTAVTAAGVMGKTGIETAEYIKGIVETVKPSAVIAVDALAARRVSRLGCTVQMSDTGISPGSGVGNARSAVTDYTTGVPVIAIGIPTVVDAHTLISDLTDGKCGADDSDSAKMIVTPREIDLVIDRAARLIGLTVNKALQPHLSVDEIMMLSGG